MATQTAPCQEPVPDPTAARPLAVHVIQAKSVLNRMRPFRRQIGEAAKLAEWSINPYRGCQHGCAYCYARRTHTDFDMNGAADFEREIFVKAGAAEILRQELRARRRGAWHAPVVIGTAVDPYQPVEGTWRVTRDILAELCAARAPVQIITKNTMVTRDADILAEIARHNHCAVFMSITTLDADLARRLEPATPPPLKRLAAVRRLVERGVPAGVMAAPILPWLTDGRGDLEALALAAHRHQAQWLSAGTLRLHPDVRPVFMAWLARERPHLIDRYTDWYRWTEAPSHYRERLHARIDAIRAALGLADGPPAYEPKTVQMTLF
jgi:DNA repair photolyase